MEECSICLESLEADITVLKCLHHFHTKCIINYVVKYKKDKCPICRSPAIYLNRCSIKYVNGDPVYYKYTPKVSCCSIL